MEWDHHGNNELEDELPFRFAASPFLANFHGGQVDTLAKTRRRREGVYDECCRKSCPTASYSHTANKLSMCFYTNNVAGFAIMKEVGVKRAPKRK